MAYSSSFVGVQNLAAVFGSLTATTEASGFPVTNIVRPNIRTPWRSTTVGVDQFITINLGSARDADIIGISGVNFTQVQFQQNTIDTTPGWASPAYPGVVETISRDPDRREYRRWSQKASGLYTLQYTRIRIPAQATTDSANYFQVGNVWLGKFTVTPRQPRLKYDRERVVPMVTHAAGPALWEVSYVSGDGFSRQSYARHAVMTQPGEWDAWMDLDRTIEEAGMLFCYIVKNWGAYSATGGSGIWIMRQKNSSKWSSEDPTVEDAWELHELVAEG